MATQRKEQNEDLLELEAFRRKSAELQHPLIGSRDLIGWQLIRVAALAQRRLEADIHRPRGWSWVGFRIMYITYVLTTVEAFRLTRIIGASAPSISGSLATLERDGFIERRPSPLNRKTVDVFLTEKGQTAIEEVLPAHYHAEDAMFASLSERDKAQLSRLLDKVMDQLWPR